MDYQLTEDQAALISGLQSILRNHGELPQSHRLSYSYFDADLQRILGESGYLDSGYDIGSLEAALVVIETARIPGVVEVAASTLVLPALLPESRLAGPVALISGQSLDKAQRNLPIAKIVVVDLGDDVAIIPISADEVEPIKSILAYPYGRFKKPPDLSSGTRIPGAGATMRQWWRVALAAEFAGAARSAVDFMVEYVKQRKVFGKPVGTFQSVQHRLVHCHMAAMGVYYLALRAAWSKDPYHADIAACFAQQQAQRLVVDLHQFNGGMGVTNENLLHFWTYRLRALQGEVGASPGAALDIANRLWALPPDTANAAIAEGRMSSTDAS